MSSEMKVAVDNLTRHASTVDAVVDQLNTALDAAQQVSLDNDAYGIICRPFAWMLDPVEQNGVDALSTAVQSMTELADTQRVTAADYQAIDDENRDMLGELDQ